MVFSTVVKRGFVALPLLFAAAAPATAADQIRFGTDWLAEAEHGGYYQALASGIYNKYDLNVDIIPGKPQVNNAQLLGAGLLDFAILSSALQVLNLAKEAVPIVAIAAFYQKCPLILMAHEQSGIRSLYDMRGHPIFVSAYARSAYWPWLRSQYGFIDDMLRPYVFALEPFLHDSNGVQQAYLTSEPYAVRQHGANPKVFLLADYGLRDYAAVLVVRREFMESHAELIGRFLTATKEGWKEFLHGDPTPAYGEIKRQNPDMQNGAMLYARQTLIDSGIVESGDAVDNIGAMTSQRWNQISKQLEKSQ